MKERPILFSAPMVRALLSGAKTQTRRAIKRQPWAQPEARDDGRWELYAGDEAYPPFDCPYGKPGDRLWVKETIRKVAEHGDGYASSEYVADGSPTVADAWPWQRPTLVSIHCPRGLSRITLDITEVRAERLQDISREDAAAEGADAWAAVALPPAGQLEDPRVQFALLWQAINGATSWDTNPWVWALTFRRLP